jgi:hypothetical protein
MPITRSRVFIRQAITNENVEKQAEQTSAQQTQAEVTNLQAQLKAAQAQLAAAREAEKQLRLQAKAERDANKDTRTKLEKVIARQFGDTGGKWLRLNITHRAYERIKAGQPIEQAIDEVLAQYGALMLETLQLPTAPANAE